jgi:hypothetical protein
MADPSCPMPLVRVGPPSPPGPQSPSRPRCRIERRSGPRAAEDSPPPPPPAVHALLRCKQESAVAGKGRARESSARALARGSPSSATLGKAGRGALPREVSQGKGDLASHAPEFHPDKQGCWQACGVRCRGAMPHPACTPRMAPGVPAPVAHRYGTRAIRWPTARPHRLRIPGPIAVCDDATRPGPVAVMV